MVQMQPQCTAVDAQRVITEKPASSNRCIRCGWPLTFLPVQEGSFRRAVKPTPACAVALVHPWPGLVAWTKKTCNFGDRLCCMQNAEGKGIYRGCLIAQPSTQRRCCTLEKQRLDVPLGSRPNYPHPKGPPPQKRKDKSLSANTAIERPEHQQSP